MNDLGSASGWKARFEKCTDIFVKLELEPDCDDEGKLKRGAKPIDPKVAKVREQLLRIEESDKDRAKKLVAFIEKSLSEEQHHQTRIQCVRLLKMVLKTFKKDHFKKNAEKFFQALIGKCIVDKRENLNGLCVPVMIELWKKVCLEHTEHIQPVFA